MLDADFDELNDRLSGADVSHGRVFHSALQPATTEAQSIGLRSRDRRERTLEVCKWQH
jgi:hypothetical protein